MEGVEECVERSCSAAGLPGYAHLAGPYTSLPTQQQSEPVAAATIAPIMIDTASLHESLPRL